MPSAPVTFSSSFWTEREVMKHSANMLISISDNFVQVIFFVVFDLFASSGIDLLRQKSACLNHEIWKKLNALFPEYNLNLQLRELFDPYVSDIHLEFVSSVRFLLFLADWNRRICRTVDVVASFSIIIVSFILLDSLWPPQWMEDLWSLVFLESFRWKVSELPDGGKSSFSGFGIVGDAVNNQQTQSFIMKNSYL